MALTCYAHCFLHISQILPAFSQLRENYVRKSGEGLSLAFLFIWFAGDALNLIGAWRQELLWTMVSSSERLCMG